MISFSVYIPKRFSKLFMIMRSAFAPTSSRIQGIPALAIGACDMLTFDTAADMVPANWNEFQEAIPSAANLPFPMALHIQKQEASKAGPVPHTARAAKSHSPFHPSRNRSLSHQSARLNLSSSPLLLLIKSVVVRTQHRAHKHKNKGSPPRPASARSPLAAAAAAAAAAVAPRFFLTRPVKGARG